MKLLSDLETVCEVVSDNEGLARVASDEASGGPRQTPAALCLPKTAAEVSEILAVCRAHQRQVVPRGAGTGKAGGAVARDDEGVVLSLEKMDRELDIDPESLSATVSAGVVVERIQDEVTALGLRYPPDPNSVQWATLGGTIATNAGGPCALKYGVTSDYVLGIECVYASGERAFVGRRTNKGVCGYDLARALVGSEGTLAIFTGATLRLVPRPRAIATALLGFQSAAAAARSVTRALTQGVWPSALEYVDQKSIAASRAAGSKAFPDVAAAIIIEVEGDDEDSAQSTLASAAETMRASDAWLAKDARDARKIWDARKVLSVAVKGLKAHKISEDVCVPRRHVVELLARFDQLGQQHGIATCAYGHAGDGNVHAQILFDDERDRARVDALLDDLMKLTVELGGTITGEHGVGAMKQKWVELEHGPVVVQLERQLKALFDPEGRLPSIIP